MSERITSLSNPLIKQARALRQRKARVESGLFLVEGIHHVGEVFEAGWDIRSVLYAPELLTSGFAKDLIPKLDSKQIHAQAVSSSVMESLADKDNPQGILALVSQRTSTISALSIADISSAVALVSPQDPGNVGSILRTMDAVNVDALFLLDGGVDMYHPSVVRASMGTLFWKPVIIGAFDEFVTWANQNHVQLIGASAHADMGYREAKPSKPWALVLGSEQKGLSSAHLAACDLSVSLPMRGRASSLNLSVAAGVLLYQFGM
ncbi:MAG: 23S rRNA (uridine(2479)-2'-O)-methyltransferase [Anaerolineales bacterium]|nr:23S rRNA (uridine(2479)-2'-O)-methyltransferase [Anaerolineales bacterium]